MLSRVPRVLFTATVVAAIGVLLSPLLDRQLTRIEQRATLAQLAVAARERPTPVGSAVACTPPEVLARLDRLEPTLAVWESIGGCGVGGGPSSAAGGVKWIGRSVTGGLFGVECITSVSILDGGYATVINMRPSTELFDKLVLGASVPFVIKVQDVDVLGETKTAVLPGWGDISFDVTYKLGLTNSSRLTLAVATPTGAHNSVRQGVVMPQQAQLGAGNFSGSLTFEHSADKMWGMLLTGVSASYGGGENSIGDYRAPGVSAYLYGGYLLGPFVPSVGISFSLKAERDRERRIVLADQSLATAALSLGVEWASDYIAVLLAASANMSLDNGVESWTLGLGGTTSLF